MSASELSFELELPQGAAAGDYRFLAMSGREALGRLFEFHIRFVSDRPAIDPLKLLGEKVRLSMQTEDGQRHFHAYATAFEYRGPIELPLAADAKAVPQYHYAVVARPWLWFLTRSTDCRVFQKLKVPEICDQIFGKYAGMVKKKLDGDYRPWEYCVQYRESDFNFVSRLMEQEGIFYFFEHDKTDHALKLVDLHGPTTPVKHRLLYVPGQRAARMKTECIHAWNVQHRMQPGAFAIKDFDFKKPGTPLMSVVKRPYAHALGALEVFDYPGEFDTAGEGEGYVRVRLEELRAQHETVHAACNVRAIAAGDVFELDNPEQAGAAAKRKYLVTEAAFELSAGLEHEAQGARYGCSFSCIRAEEQFRPERATPKTAVQGPQTAVVVGPPGEEIHTDEHGRVKVQFHWDRYGHADENSSCWIRVSHPWAGKGWGSVSIPRIGQEVIVDFLEGDPDRPIVTGRVYNGDNKAPFSLPGDAVVSGLKSNTHKGRGYNEMSMNDTAGKEKINIHAQYDMTTKVEHDDAQTVVNNRTIGVDGTHTETIKGDTTITVTQGKLVHDVAAGTADYHVQGAVTEKFDATQSTTVKNAITIVSTAGPIAVSSDAQHVYINAATSIQLHVGASMIWMDSGGQINIQGVNVAINGSAAVTIKGGIVHSEAQSEHQTKGAVVLSDGSATNTVRGGMVMLNP